MRQPTPGSAAPVVRLWTGFVEDRTDPMQLGRLRVRINGFHTQDKSLIPTQHLPWAVNMMPASNTGVSGVGASPNGAMIGTLVIGTWMDGEDMQNPIVLGAINQQEGAGLHSQSSNTINDQRFGVPGNFNPTGDGPSWLQTARGEIGQKEIKGGQFNPRVYEYMQYSGARVSDSTPWCSAFAIWCLKATGASTQGLTAAAKSFLTAPSMETLTELRYGAIVVFHRPPRPTSGHVGFYVGSQGGRLKILGGNQSNAVNIKGYSANRVAGIRWPRGASET